MREKIAPRKLLAPRLEPVLERVRCMEISGIIQWYSAATLGSWTTQQDKSRLPVYLIHGRMAAVLREAGNRPINDDVGVKTSRQPSMLCVCVCVCVHRLTAQGFDTCQLAFAALQIRRCLVPSQPILQLRC